MSVKTINEAIIAAKKVIKNPKKTSTNPLFKSSYADLNEVLQVINDALPDNVNFTQSLITKDDNQMFLELTLISSDDSEIVSTIPIIQMDTNRGTNKLQMLGQSITYLRRYQLQTFFGLGADDNDGNNEPGANKNRPAKRPSENTINIKEIGQINRGISVLAGLMETSEDEIEKTVKEKFKFDDINTIDQNQAKIIIKYIADSVNASKK